MFSCCFPRAAELPAQDIFLDKTSGFYIIPSTKPVAAVAELADARDLKSLDSETVVPVRSRPAAPKEPELREIRFLPII